MRIQSVLFLLLLITAPLQVLAESRHAPVIIQIQSTDAKPKNLGTLTLIDSEHGLIIKPNLHGLTPGMHGFHIHSMPSCEKGGKAAGGHFDPLNTGLHLGPYAIKGHIGDLPRLFVDENGRATFAVLAPRLSAAFVWNHAVIIHANGDNYADTPAKLGGGGARVACGVFE